MIKMCICTTGITGFKQGGDQTGGDDSRQQVLCRHDNDDDDDDDGDGDEAESVMELDFELEDDLCKLWDASINEVRK